MNSLELVALASGEDFKRRVKLIAYKKAIDAILGGASGAQKAAAQAVITDKVNIGQIALGVVTRDAIIALPNEAAVTDQIIATAVMDVVPAYL